MLNKTDVAVIVVDSQAGFGEQEEKLLNRMQEKQIPCVLVFNKMDQKNAVCPEKIKDIPVLGVSARTKAGITELKETIAKAAKTEAVSKPLVSDLLDPSDFVVLVVPIDKAAPKGRLILPQQQTIRDYFGSSWACALRTGYGASPDIRRTVCQTTNGHHRQSGFCSGRPTDAKRYPSYFLFNPVCKA